ncbi:MAG: [FeFe] hydrogenase H-cluster radical SAM maturase HydG [Planctomycetaceae bacterium]|nr:[FeFe] hydrogenase H-cluster radical SAM maturase HydG [Planctomycetaceae bacterium]
MDRRALSTSGYHFIDEDHFDRLLQREPDRGAVRDVIAKSMAKVPLEPEETAVLLRADDPDLAEEIFDAARQLKRDVYGNRIVLFAPLYVGSYCRNDCLYCAFRSSNRDVVRHTLSPEELASQVETLERHGHKRLILVFGEHPAYSPEFIADCVRRVYATRVDHGEIRRVNINAAPLDHAGFRVVKEAGIGTYQVFQETYHRATYAAMHAPESSKGDYLWRLDSPARAIESECDDVGIGALFGLYDWRFEVLSLVAHSRHLQKHYGVGPHTISFPRLRPALGVKLDDTYIVSDDDFKRLVAILRLSVPYTGMILTARETAEVRREVMAFGVSQIDAGSRIELAGYTAAEKVQQIEKEQFELGDLRSLDEVMRELILDGYVPSFCTACYRAGRTGEHFMEFAIPGFIQNLCTPNALTTLQEYLSDYGSEETRAAGARLIEKELNRLSDGPRKQELRDRLRRIQQTDQRDLYF